MPDSAPAADAAGATAREVSIFLCYRRSDGSWFAEWLYRRLNGVEYLDNEGHRCRIRAYYDKTAPGVGDWKALHFPSLQTATALVVICTPGIAKDFSRRSHPDWVYEELRWWVRRRASAPIVVDTTGEGERWLPELLTKQWPDINRIALNQKDAEYAAHAGDQEYEVRIRERVVGAVRESERRTLFEDLERSHRQEKRLRWALTAASLLLVLAAFLGYYANKQTLIAQDRLALMGELLMSSDSSMDELMLETLKRTNETQFVVVALDVLICYRSEEHRQDQTVRPASILQAILFKELLATLDLIKDREVTSRVQMLRANLEADRKGTPRPHGCRLAKRPDQST